MEALTDILSALVLMVGMERSSEKSCMTRVGLEPETGGDVTGMGSKEQCVHRQMKVLRR